jgi:chemotaxis protein MotB
MSEPENEGEEDTPHHEIVIIRRRGDGEEAPHKGGVWKIAHADFMTALMAFFLVMWLITATDDTTVTGVANYFNPMRLSDSATKPKGLFTMEEGREDDSESKDKKPAETEGKEPPAETADAKYSEAALFSEPYEALDKIAEQAPDPAQSQGDPKGKGGPAIHPGEAFRDPFNPDVHYGPVRQGKDGAAGADKAGDGGGTVAEDASSESTVARAKSGTGPDADLNEAGFNDVGHSKGELKKAIDELVRHSGFSAKPNVEVQATSEGLLISITDQFDFEMFGIASARPKPELVVLMDKIGRLIATRPEHIIIRGHTDGRPFRSRDYDNWRLSTARAHMANYMLVRSGVPEDRINRIEGHADHDLKVPSDPNAATNRRIEILLKDGKP